MLQFNKILLFALIFENAFLVKMLLLTYSVKIYNCVTLFKRSILIDLFLLPLYVQWVWGMKIETGKVNFDEVKIKCKFFTYSNYTFSWKDSFILKLLLFTIYKDLLKINGRLHLNKFFPVIEFPINCMGVNLYLMWLARKRWFLFIILNVLHILK